MPRPHWSDDRAFNPKITARSYAPVLIEVDRRSDHAEAVERLRGALLIGEEVVIVGRNDGARALICRAVPAGRETIFITKDHRSTGLRPDAQTVMRDAARAITLEFNADA